MDIKLNVLHDLDIVNNDLVIIEPSRDAVIQELSIRLQFYYGEWFLDVTQGIPYLQYIFKKGSSIQSVNGIFIKEINKVEEVNEILEFSSTFDGSSRNFEIDFKLDTIYGIIQNKQRVTI